MLALLATSMLINELLGGNVTAMMNDENCWQNKDSFWLLTLIKDLLQSAENPQGLTQFLQQKTDFPLFLQSVAVYVQYTALASHPVSRRLTLCRHFLPYSVSHFPP